MKKKVLEFIKNPFLINVIILSSGTAGAQIVAMLLSPIITRLYGPEAYGVMGTFTAIITIITPIAALTYPMAIVLPKKDSEAKGLIKLSLLITMIIATIVTLFILLLNDFIVDLFQFQDLSFFLYLIPFVILFLGTLQVLEQWLIRKKLFAVSAKATFFQAIVVNGGKVIVGIFYPAAFILILFSSLRPGINALFMVLFAKYFNIKKIITLFCSKVSIKKLAKKYRDFPFFRTPEMFLSSISGDLPIILLSILFGPASAGFYSIGRTVLNIPTILISKSIGDVFYPRISEAANNKENLTNLILKATLLLALIGVIPYGIVIIFGPWIFGIVFGEAWIVAGEYARWIAFWAYFSFINRPSVRSLPVLYAQRFHLFYTVITLIVRVLALFIGFYVFKSDIVAVALFGLSGALLNIGLVLITLLISKRYDKTNKVR